MSDYTPTTEEVRNSYKSGAWLKGREGVPQFNPDEYRPIYFAEFDRWLAEVERAAARQAWEEGVATALNHAKRGSDGITLKLVTFDGDAWKNPYREGER